MKNKLLSLFLVALGILFLAGCGSSEDSSAAENEAADESATEDTATSEESELETDGDVNATTVASVEIMGRLVLDIVGVPTSYKDLTERYSDATQVGTALDPD